MNDPSVAQAKVFFAALTVICLGIAVGEFAGLLRDSLILGISALLGAILGARLVVKARDLERRNREDESLRVLRSDSPADQ
jgi:hypothetical protein